MKLKGTRGEPPPGKRHLETTRDERLQIVTLREHGGMGWAEIGRRLNINRHTVQKIYQRTKANGTPSNRKRTGRPPKFDDDERRKLVAFVTRDARTRRLTWEAIVAEMGYACSAKTVKRVMAEMGYHKQVPRKKFDIHPANKPERVEWCQAHLHWTYEEWKRVIWTGDSTFSTSDFGHRPWVIRTADEEYHTDCVDETFEQGSASRMAWGAFCGKLKSSLVWILGNAKVNSQLYVEQVMEPHLVPFWHRCCEEYGWTKVVEDGAPGHKGQANDYRALNEMDVIQWPAQSSDLNPMECLWADVETELGEILGGVSNVEDLRDCVTKVWDAIVEERLDSLIRSMPERLQKVIDAGGDAIPY